MHVRVGARAVQGAPELLNVRTPDPVMATAMGVGAARHVIVAESLASASTLVPLSVPRRVLPAARIARVPRTRRALQVGVRTSMALTTLILIAVVFIVSDAEKSKVSKSIWRG